MWRACGVPQAMALHHAGEAKGRAWLILMLLRCKPSDRAPRSTGSQGLIWQPGSILHICAHRGGRGCTVASLCAKFPSFLDQSGRTARHFVNLHSRRACCRDLASTPNRSRAGQLLVINRSTQYVGEILLVPLANVPGFHSIT